MLTLEGSVGDVSQTTMLAINSSHTLSFTCLVYTITHLHISGQRKLRIIILITIFEPITAVYRNSPLSVIDIVNKTGTLLLPL